MYHQRWASRTRDHLVYVDLKTQTRTDLVLMNKFGALCSTRQHNRSLSATPFWENSETVAQNLDSEGLLVETLSLLQGEHQLVRRVQTHMWLSLDGRAVDDHQFDTEFATDSEWHATLAVCDPPRLDLAKRRIAFEQILEIQGVKHADARYLASWMGTLLPRRPPMEWVWPRAPEYARFYPCDWLQTLSEWPARVRLCMPCLTPVYNRTQWVLDDQWLPVQESASFWSLLIRCNPF